MNYLQRALVLAGLCLLAPVLALADGAPEPPADARQQLQKLRTTAPQQYARVRHNLAVFLALPPDRQESLRKLDRELQDEPTHQRARLERVMERYGDWLERLPDADRENILSAPDRKTRLQRIREIRERHWQARLPKAVQDKLAKAPQAERPEMVKKLRQEELDSRLDWIIAQRNWDMLFRNPGGLPTRLDMFSEDTRAGFEQSVRPLLSRDQEKQLKDAEGKWPRYPRLFVELVDSHPYSVLGPIGPLNFKDVKELSLPAPIHAALASDGKVQGRLKEVEGKWPDYGAVLRDSLKEMRRKPPFLLMKNWPALPGKFTPARPADFSPSVATFIDKKLVPALSDDEVFQLKKAEGDWPAYPKMIVDLARKHNLQVPGLPSRLDSPTWERYRWRPLGPPPPSGRRPEPFWLPF
jgi:hypothetical protein